MADIRDSVPRMERHLEVIVRVMVGLVQVFRGERSGSAEIRDEASAILGADDDASPRSVTEFPLPSSILSEGGVSGHVLVQSERA